MAIDDKIRHAKLQCDINREIARISTLSGKFDNLGYHTSRDIYPFNQSQMIEQGIIIYCTLRKSYEIEE